MIEIVQSIQSSIEIAGKLRELSKKISDADFKMYLADLSIASAGRTSPTIVWQPIPVMLRLRAGTRVERLCGHPEQK